MLPPGVLNVITGHGETVGAALVSHPAVRMSSLTGRCATGKEVMRLAAGNLKRLHLELGGKAPVIVFDDADLELTVAKIREGGYMNSGQDCMAASRVYASGGIHDDLLRLVRGRVDRDGRPHQRGHRDGTCHLRPAAQPRRGFRRPRARDRARAARHRREDQWQRLLLPAERRRRRAAGGWIVQKEVFGPVVSVTRFDDDREVLRWANDVEYGLAASVFTSNVGRALDAARVLQFGTIWINDHMPIAAEMPHGGFKQSGNGKDMSVYSLEEYTEIKHVMVNLHH